MKTLNERISTFDGGKRVHAVVETPKGSDVKYAYDSKCGLFQLKLVLPEGMVFPFNFGFVPGTRADDGDPLDILVLNSERLITGCLLTVRLLGVITANQIEDGKATRNDRLAGVALGKDLITSRKPPDLSRQTQVEIEHFFVSYNRLHGRKFKILGVQGPAHAAKLVAKGAAAYRREPDE